MSVRVVLEETGFGVRAAVLVDDRLVEIRDSDRDDPAVSEALFAARVTAVDVKLNAAFLDCGLPQPALMVAKDARAACRPGGTAADPAAGARGRPADRPGRARGRGRQGGAGHQRSQAVRLRPGLQPGRRGGGAGAAAGPAARGSAAAAGPGAVPRRQVRASPPRGRAAGRRPAWPRRRSWPSGGGGWRLDPERSSPAGCRSPRRRCSACCAGSSTSARRRSRSPTARFCWRWSGCGPRVPRCRRSSWCGWTRTSRPSRRRRSMSSWRSRWLGRCRWLGAAGC